MIAARPPGRNTPGSTRSNCSRFASSRFTRIRSAWNVRAAGCRFHLPGCGWAGYDPTHGCRTDARHVRVAVGRDYSDVTPLRGVYRSFGTKQTMSVELKLERAPLGNQMNQNGYSQQ